MKILTKAGLLAAREVRYRRRMNLRLKDQRQAVAFVNDVGFCFLFPIQKMEMPSLWDAIAGRVVKTYSDHKGMRSSEPGAGRMNLSTRTGDKSRDANGLAAA